MLRSLPDLPFSELFSVSSTITAFAAIALAVPVLGGASSQRQLFRTSVQVVELDVVATHPDGRPVLDLTVDDLEVFEDGRRVDVVSFRAIQVPSRATPALQSAAPPTGVIVASNERADEGRLLVVVLDVSDHAQFYRVRQIVLALLERLGPGDQVAMFANGGSAAYQVEFTTDRSRVAQALHSGAILGAGRDRLLRVLTRAANSLRGVSGRRKILAVISEGLPEIPRSVNIGEENHVPELQEFLSAAFRANVSVYAFNPRHAFGADGMVGAESVDERASQLQEERDSTIGLQTIADATGGRALVRSNGFEAAIARMLADSASYYLLGYTSSAPPDGTFHHVTIRTRRADINIRTRSGFISPRSGSGAQIARIDQLVSAPVQSSGLPLRMVAVAAPSRSSGATAVHVVVEVSGTGLVDAEGVELRVLAIDVNGRVRATNRYAARLQAPSKNDGIRWLRIASSAELPPGKYQLRGVVARTDGTAAGSVFAEIVVPDFRQGFVIGGLVLGTAAGPAALAGADRIMSDLQLLPMATRELPAQMAVIRAGLPVQVSAHFDSGVVLFIGRLVASDGTAREIVRAERTVRSLRPERTFNFDVPLDGLPAGEYQLTVEVASGGFSARRSTSFRILP